jgi:hypothetical protein
MTVVNYSYHRIIRKIVVAFGNLFNDITLTRYDTNGNEVQHFVVPIHYAEKEKYLVRLQDDPYLDKKVQITLPAMSFEMTNMAYDATRKQITNARNFAPGTDSSSILTQYNPVPFNFDFSLYAYVRNIEDGAQLMEKILPYFTPDYTIKVNLIPEMGIIKQLPIILKDVTNQVDYEGEYSSDTRKIIWTLNFTVKGFLYGPVQSSKIIKQSITNILDQATLGSQNVIFKMGSGGFGTYKENEVVYQGYSQDTATATAKVYAWDSQNKELEVTNINGNFIVGSALFGAESLSNYTLQSYYLSPVHLAKVAVTANPNTVILPNNYTYLTSTLEFPNAG